MGPSRSETVAAAAPAVVGVVAGLATRGGIALLAEAAVVTILLPWLGATHVRATGALGSIETLARHPARLELVRAARLLSAVAVGLVAGGLIALIEGAGVGAFLGTRSVLLTWGALAVALGVWMGRPVAAVLAAALIAMSIVVAAPLFSLLPGQAWVVTTVVSSNPLVAIFDAAGTDLLRSEPFYWMSPAATLPGSRLGWPLAASAYMLAGICAYAFSRATRRTSPSC